jgi:single-stranded-DNA-specific exonuclease
MAQFDLLSESLRADCAERMPDAALVPSILIDAEIDQHLVSLPLVQALARLEPFGQGNPEPTFLLRNILVSSPRGVGGEGQHLRASVGQIAAIGFGLAHVLPRVQGAVDAVCRLSLNVWNGRVSPQLVIQDIRSAAATKDVTEKIANGDLRVANG